MTIPIVLLLHVVLTGHASRWPGSRGFEDDFRDEVKDGKEKAGLSLKSTKNDHDEKTNTDEVTTAERLRGDIRASAFGAEIKKAILNGSAVDGVSESTKSQIAYAGEN